MKKIILASFVSFIAVASFAQTTTNSTETPKSKKKNWALSDLKNRPNDHFMLELGYDGWAQVPDSIHTKGFGRHFNFYLMYDMPFKSDPRFSIGLGVGVGSSNIYFDKQEVDVAGTSQFLAFPDVSQKDHFKKFKLTTAYLEAPLELRWVQNPENTNKGWKIALGAKFGYLINAHTRGKNLESSSGSALNNYVEKERSNRYFNSVKVAGTARINYGWIGVHFDYQVTKLIKDNMGPAIHPYSIGLVISGL